VLDAEAPRFFHHFQLRRRQLLAKFLGVPEERRERAIGVMEDGIDVVEVELAERAHPLRWIVVQHHCAARRPQQVHVRAAGEEPESEFIERAREHCGQLAGRHATPTLLDEGMCEIELLHIRVLFGFPCRAAPVIVTRPRASSNRQRRFRTDRDTR
jgi:hypothetical protein